MAHELKMALVFRSDLPMMTRGKSELQAAHAACDLVYDIMKNGDSVTRALMDRYMELNQPKVNVEVDDELSLHRIAKKAQERGVPCRMITDEGRTVFDGPTVTCLLLGPTSQTNANALTRGTNMRDRARLELVRED